MSGDGQASGADSASMREMVAVIILSVTTILTAWSAFQSSKWGGAMSISFSEASGARIESARLDGAADAQRSIQVGLWTQWIDAEAAGNDDIADFIEERFPEPLDRAHADWLATDPLTDPTAPSSPFVMDSYVLANAQAARAENERADAAFDAALVNNQRGDNYTLLTVLFAAVLFFTAMSGRVRSPRSQLSLMVFAVGLGFIGVALLLVFPTLI